MKLNELKEKAVALLENQIEEKQKQIESIRKAKNFEELDIAEQDICPRDIGIYTLCSSKITCQECWKSVLEED